MATTRKKKESTQRLITRKVFFYRVNAGVHFDTGEPLEVDFRLAIKHLSTMPFTSDGRYLDTEDGKQLCCRSDSSGAPYHIRLANIRRGNIRQWRTLGHFPHWCWEQEGAWRK
jgi:hypothetical protein